MISCGKAALTQNVFSALRGQQQLIGSGFFFVGPLSNKLRLRSLDGPGSDPGGVGVPRSVDVKFFHYQKQEGNFGLAQANIKDSRHECTVDPITNARISERSLQT